MTTASPPDIDASQRRPNGLLRRVRSLSPPLLLTILMAAIAAAMAFKTYRVAVKPGPGVVIEEVVVASDLLRGMRGEAAAEARVHDRMPGFPLLLAALARLDPRLETVLACRDPRDRLCDKRALTGVLALQYLVGLSMLFAALLIALRLSGSPAVAGIAVALLYLGTRPGDLAGVATWNIWHQALIMWGGWLTLLAHVRASPLLGLAGGSAFGASASLEPHAAVLVPAVALVLALARREAGDRTTRRVVTAMAALSGGALALGGIVGLAIALGCNPEAPLRYLMFRTAERAAYDGLALAPWLTGLVLPVPVIGDWLQGLVLPDSLTRLFAMYVPGSLAHRALVETYPQALAASGSALAGLGSIAHAMIFADPLGYLAAMPPVLSRGLWGGASLVGLLGLFHVGVMVRYARGERRGAALAVLCVPIAALLVVNTLLTANHYFLNPMLPFLYAYAIAYVSGGL